MRRRSRRIYGAAGAFVVAALLAAAVVAREDAGSRPGAAPQGHRGGHQGAAPRSFLSILARSRRSGDAVPASLAEGPLLSDGVADLRGARRVGAFARPTWIAPSADGEAVCLFAAGALTCPGLAVIEERGAAVGLFKSVDTPWRVLGVAADGVPAVTVVRADGSRLRLDVRANFFAFEDSRPPRELRWRGPSGEQLWRRGRISWPGAAAWGL